MESKKKKCAFITGAASGLGRAMSLYLHEQGWQLALSDISSKGLQETMDLLKSGENHRAYHLDVSDATQYKGVIDKFMQDFGRIDLLINNAGVGDGCVFEDYSLANWQWLIGINQMGVIHGCHFFVPIMKAQASGHVLNISSAASFSAAPRMSAYNTSKAAVKALSETLYSELAEFGIGVSLAMPFFFQTNVMQHARGDEESRQMGQWMVGSSKLDADTMARRILRKCLRAQFYIVEPWQGKLLFALSRFAPRLFLWINKQGNKRRPQLKRHLQQRHDRINQKRGANEGV